MSVAFPQKALGALVVEIHWPTLQSKLFTKRDRVRDLPKFYFILFLSHKTITGDEEAIPLWIIVGPPTS